MKSFAYQSKWVVCLLAACLSSYTAPVAAVAATGGNSVVEAGEQCDPPGPCCVFNCQFADAGTSCRPAAHPCDIVEACVGTSATCPADVAPACTATPTPTLTPTATLSPTITRTPAPGANDCCDCGSFCLAAAGTCGVCETVFGAVCGAGGCETHTPTVTSTPTSTPTPTFTWTAGPSPTQTSTPTNTPTPTATPTPTQTGTPTRTPTPMPCCQCPNPACGPPTTPGSMTCQEGCTFVPNGVCQGGMGMCQTITPTGTITRTFTLTSTPTETPTKTPTATITLTPLLGEFAADPFKCYRVKPEDKFAKIEGLTLVDELEQKEIKLIKPQLLCTPADIEGQGINHPDEFLLCFKIRQMPGQPAFARKTGLVVRNQFGDNIKVSALAPGLLCVPSRLAAGRVPTATRTPTPA